MAGPTSSTSGAGPGPESGRGSGAGRDRVRPQVARLHRPAGGGGVWAVDGRQDVLERLGLFAGRGGPQWCPRWWAPRTRASPILCLVGAVAAAVSLPVDGYDPLVAVPGEEAEAVEVP